MRDSEVRRLETFLRVRVFHEERAEQFPAHSLAADLFAQLNDIITSLQAHSTAQASGKHTAHQGSTSKSVARDELLTDLEAISRTARGMALTMPGLDDKFRMPRNVGNQELLAVARAFAADAVPLKDEFIRRGMPADFLEDLNADIASLEQAINSKIQGTESHIAATAAIDDAIDGGMNIVRQLDSIVRNIFAGDAAALEAWRKSSRVERPPKREEKKQTPTPPQP